jgi:hypothetical protein
LNKAKNTTPPEFTVTYMYTAKENLRKPMRRNCDALVSSLIYSTDRQTQYSFNDTYIMENIAVQQSYSELLSWK